MKNQFWIAVLLIGFFSGANLVAQDLTRVRERIKQQAMNRFDEDGDGKLSVSEREKAQSFLRERRYKPDAGRDREVEPIVNPKTTPLYKLAAGPYAISHQDFDLVRESGEPSLPMKVTFPLPGPGSWETSALSLPVIVFSHGAGGSCDTYQPLTEYWASHGYIVLQPTHGDSLSLLSTRDRQQIRLKSYVTEGGVSKYLIPRTNDIKLVLDRFTEIQQSIPDLKFKLDADRVGLGGHSYGAYTTQMIGGLSIVNPLTKRHATYADPRPKTLLMISPQGLGGLIDRDSFKEMTRPAMVVTGSNDEGVTGQPASWRLDAFKELPAQTKYLAFIEGAVHNFGGISGVKYLGSGDPNPDHVYYVKSSTLAWWDSQLKADKAATEYLDSEKLQAVTDWVARISKTVEVKPAAERAEKERP